MTQFNSLKAYELPTSAAPAELAGTTAVVIDVLRATTTIVHALAAGARSVVPCLTIEDARVVAAGLPPQERVLAGERGGLPIDGFDLGNSPAEFTPQSVAGKDVVLTTTNGTRALLHCRQAARILVGSFANLTALCEVLSGCDRVDLICAGTDGQATDEDLLFAGAIAERLGISFARNLIAEGCRNGWQSVVRNTTGAELTDRIVGVLRSSRGGRNLVALGMDADIELAAQIDRFDLVPRFYPDRGRIVRS